MTASQPPQRPERSQRLGQLDGLRAAAIIGVLIYHYGTERDATAFPYGGAWDWLPLAGNGNLGVQLFFIISGFVIFLTLERCRGRGDFAFRRFARLWPALVLCTLISFGIVAVFGSRPQPESPLDIAASLVVAPPQLWQSLVPGVSYVDSALWSLWVEILFYAVAAGVYFLRPDRFLRNLAIAAGAIFCVRMLLVVVAAQGSPEASDAALSALVIFPLGNYIFWFLFGAAMFALYQRRETALAAAVAALAFVMQCALYVFPGPGGGKAPMPGALTAIAVMGLFAAAVFVPVVARAFSWRPLIAVGRGSYSTYLLNMVAGGVLIVAIGQATGLSGRSAMIIMPAVAGLMVMAGILVARWWEVPSQRWLQRSRQRPRDASPRDACPPSVEPARGGDEVVGALAARSG